MKKSNVLNRFSFRSIWRFRVSRIGLILFFMSFYGFSYAQPQRTEMLERVKNKFSKNLLSSELIEQGKAVREYEDGAWKDNFYQRFRITKKTEYEGVKYVYEASLKYTHIGGSWNFEQFTVGSQYFLGVPPPDKAEVNKLLKNDLEKFLKPNYNDIVGDISEINYPDEKWFWRNLNNVEFLVTVTVNQKAGSSKLEKQIQTYKIRLFRPDFNSKWDNFDSYEEYQLRKVISEETKSTKDLEKIKSLSENAVETAAQNNLNSLPQVAELPEFVSDKQLFYFIHQKILTESPQFIEAYLYKMLNKSCFEANSTTILNSWTSKWMEKILNNDKAFKVSFCAYPTLQKYQTGRIEFFDRETKSAVTYQALQSGNTWKLTQIDFYPIAESEWNRIKMIDTNCLGKPDLEVKKPETFQVGDKVYVKFSNGTFPCTIDKLDPNMPNRYFVKLENNKSGKGYWMTDQFISKTKNAGSSSEATKRSFEVGSKVEINTSAGWLKGSIVQILGKKYRVKFQNTQFADMWVPTDLMR